MERGEAKRRWTEKKLKRRRTPKPSENYIKKTERLENHKKIITLAHQNHIKIILWLILMILIWFFMWLTFLAGSYRETGGNLQKLEAA